jgi:hypothetical protein
MAYLCYGPLWTPRQHPPGSTPPAGLEAEWGFPLTQPMDPWPGVPKVVILALPPETRVFGLRAAAFTKSHVYRPFFGQKGPKTWYLGLLGDPSQGSFHYESMLCKHRFVMKWPLGPVLGAILDHFLTHFWVIFGPFFGPPFGRSLAGSLLLGVGNGPKPLKKGSQNGPQKGPKMGQNGHFPLSQAMRGQKGSFWAILAIWTILAILTHI